MNHRSPPARATLLWALAAFAALQLGTAVLIEFWAIELRDPYFGAKLVGLQRRIDARQDHDVVVMLGSSHVADGLCGQVAERELQTLGRPAIVYNLGVPACGPMQCYVNLRRLLDAGVRPDLLLVEPLPALLDEHAGDNPHWVPADWLSWRDLTVMHSAGFPTHAMQEEWRSGWPLPWYTHRFVMVSAFMPRLLPAGVRSNPTRYYDASGWRPRPAVDPPPDARRAALCATRTKIEPALRILQLGGPPCTAVHLTLETCRRERIPVALVVMPESTEFRSWYRPAALEQLRDLLDTLASDYEVPVIDARTWVRDERFLDGHHLDDRGAAAFSERLGREVIRPLLTSRTH